MSVLEAIVMGVVQGLTEFLPVSSSGHLVLLPWLLGWSEPGLLFDTVVHWGTLLAVLIYFRKEWWQLLVAWARGFPRRDWRDPHARLMWQIILGTIPAAVLGYLFEDAFESLFSRPVWVSLFLLVTAALLTAAEYLGRQERRLADQRWKDALLIGTAQAAAIAPGISRSGATVATGLLRGVTRPEAARFSFLLSAPIILGAGLVQLLNLATEGAAQGEVAAAVAGFCAAALSGYLAIASFLRFVQARRLHGFAFYCAWVGISCLIVAWLR